MDTNEQAAPTARLNFGQRVADPAPVENTQTEAVQAEEAQQEAMTAEAEAQPEATVKAEAQTETSEASADVPDAPVTEQLVENSELVDPVNEAAAHALHPVYPLPIEDTREERRQDAKSSTTPRRRSWWRPW